MRCNCSFQNLRRPFLGCWTSTAPTNPLTPDSRWNYPDFYVQAFGEFVGNGVGIGFGAGVADDDFDSVARSVDEAAIAGWEGDGE
jgi:hypothetical protein